MWLMKNTIKNNQVAPHPELTSTLSLRSHSVQPAKVLSRSCRQQDQGKAHQGPQEEQEPLFFQQKFDFFFLCVFSFLCVAVRCIPPSTHQAVARQPCTCWEGSFAAVNGGWRGKWGDVIPQACHLGCPRGKVPMNRCKSLAVRTLMVMSSEVWQHCTFSAPLQLVYSEAL